MAKKVWEKCTICMGTGKVSPGSPHFCGACRGEKGKWVEKSDDSGGCFPVALVLILGAALSMGVGVTKALAAAGLF